MKNIPASKSAFSYRFSLTLLLSSVGLFLALLAFGAFPGALALAQGSNRNQPTGFQVGASYHNDVSPPLRELANLPFDVRQKDEGPINPKLPNFHQDSLDPVVQGSLLRQLAPNIPGPILNFDGIAYPGVGCNCAPPDTNGEIGATQYVQIVNEGYQVFNKSTGASVLGPVSIVSLWSGFGGVCQTAGDGDPVVLYDQLAGRWVISQFAGSSVPTDECIAISTTSDATGSYYRYGFHLGSNFFDYPKLAVWPDAYYMSMNVFNSAGTSFLGPQPFAVLRITDDAIVERLLERDRAAHGGGVGAFGQHPIVALLHAGFVEQERERHARPLAT